MTGGPTARDGVAVGGLCRVGLMPLYWHLLKAVPALQIVLHRIAWVRLARLVVGCCSGATARLAAAHAGVAPGGGCWR